ncbi:glycoside hydrolase family 35 protein [Aspergillus pseudoustus]|uniref:Beta-galactosidase n=1 Tax=Aspergillus pseudoustus TaxID=1810923 RepID=A0ABR4JG31_9EURO
MRRLIWNVLSLYVPLWVFGLSLARGAPPFLPERQPALFPRQELVTWDKNSLIVRGERVLILAGEFHPFRLPSPGLWLDIFQKIRATGLTAVSFYVDWALVEGEPGQIRMDGVFALEQFFAAAKEAGVYLIARPGPYINAETSGGGLPGWLSRLKGKIRTSAQDYLDAITPYMHTIANVIAKAQIHHGGPVILFQPENEYTLCYDGPSYTQVNNYTVNTPSLACLDKEYMAYVQKQYREAGIEVPFIVNDAHPVGNFAPGTGTGAADIYSFDYYPLAANSSDWSTLRNPLLAYNITTHAQMSTGTPFSISEFQGGTTDPWGGVGGGDQAALVNHEFSRVFHKLNYGMHITIQSLYMIFGGTNWGNLGHASGYTSYDFGAAISENRMVAREKYSELKLQSNFLSASPAYLTMQPENVTLGVYTDRTDLQVSRLVGDPTSFFVVHHHDLASQNSVEYTLRLPSSRGNLIIPQLGGALTLSGRDSKIHVVDYDLDGTKLLYSTAEILTWKRSTRKKVLVLYGGEDETHEFAVPASLGPPIATEGHYPKVRKMRSLFVVQWQASPTRRVLVFGTLEIHLLSRNAAYDYWVLGLPTPSPVGRFASPAIAQDAVIVKAGYLLRSADILGNALHLIGDVNATTTVEVISTPSRVSSLVFNGKRVKTRTRHGRLVGEVSFESPDIVLPDIERLNWKYTDALPEIKGTYNDEAWTRCDVTTTNNPRNLSTPTSLYASDYGYHAGSLIYRGHFTSEGTESSINILLEGGYAFGYTVWLNDTHLGGWPGSSSDMFHNQTLELPADLTAGSSYVLNVIMDHMGLDQNFPASPQHMKDPRGILDYTLSTRDKSAISWRLTGNLGGEHYRDWTRGPRNEGASYPERQGYHLPGALSSSQLQEQRSRSPFEEIPPAGVGFYATSFNLSIPAGYDVPLSIVFKNETAGPAKFRATFYVNGWQFGKYVNNVGPQTRFPVPEGILNYDGDNYLALVIWSFETTPIKFPGLSIEIDAVIQSGYEKPALVEGMRFAQRLDAY